MNPIHNIKQLSSKPVSRRTAVVASFAVMPMLLTPAIAFAKTSLQQTPSQTEGPYYPVSIPADNDWDLLRNGTDQYNKGQIAWIQGVVTDTEGKPV